MCTANVIDTIPNPLLDRMEVISIAGYITDEKVHIARDYLEKNARADCGIKPEQVSHSHYTILQFFLIFWIEQRELLSNFSRNHIACFLLQVDVSDAALLSLIENYCREAGVRNLQKQIEKIYRKVNFAARPWIDCFLLNPSKVIYLTLFTFVL